MRNNVGVIAEEEVVMEVFSRLAERIGWELGFLVCGEYLFGC